MLSALERFHYMLEKFICRKKCPLRDISLYSHFQLKNAGEEGGHKKKGKYNILIGHTCEMQE